MLRSENQVKHRDFADGLIGQKSKTALVTKYSISNINRMVWNKLVKFIHK